MSYEAWGDGPEPPPRKNCPSCDGLGEFQEVQDGLLIVWPCERCNGDGEIDDECDDRFDDDYI